MKPWWKLVRPKQDIIEGENIDLGVYAIHLDQVASGHKDTPAIYADAKTFFANTVFTKGMGTVISHVYNRLSGNTQTGSVINLNTAFGGGKTHTLVTLYHLFRNGDQARKWIPHDSLTSIGVKLGNEPLKPAKVLVWVGTNYSHNTKDANGMSTPWGQLLAQLGPEAKAAIAPFDKDRTRPDQDTIRKILLPNAPVLILMDEVLNAMEPMRGVSVGDTTLNHQFRQFYMNLTNVAAGHRGISVVNSFSKSMGNISERDQQDLELLLNVSGRVDESIETSAGNEVARIIRRRLFDDVAPEDEREITKTIKDFVGWTVQNQKHLSLDLQLSEVESSFEASFPFHPRTLQVFQKKWQGLSSFGRTRGVLRMLAIWIRLAYIEGSKKNAKQYVISLGAAPLEDELFANTVYGEMGDRDLAIPVKSDVAGSKSWAAILDGQATGAIKSAQLHQQVARAVFFESTGGQKQNAASSGEVKWAICGPDGPGFTDIDTCLENLDRDGHYFRSRNQRHYISVKATLNKLVRTERTGIPEPDVDRLIAETVQGELGKTTDIDLVVFPAKASDVPDTPRFKLCVLRPDVAPDGGAARLADVATALIDKANRKNRRHVGFLCTTQGVTKMREAARNHLTYKLISRGSSSYQLEASDKEELPSRLRQTLDDLKDEVWSAYRELWISGQDGDIERQDVLGLMNRSMSSKGLSGVVEERLFQQDICTRLVSPRILANWPEAFRGKAWPLRSIRDNVFQSSAVVRARLVSEKGLRESINNWIRGGKAVLVPLNSRGEAGEPIPADMPSYEGWSIDDELGLLLPENVTVTVPRPSPGGSSTLVVEEPGAVKPLPVVVPAEPSTRESTALSVRIHIPPRLLAKLAVDLAINIDALEATVEISGKPREGVENPLRSIREKVAELGGRLEDLTGSQ